MKLRFFALLLLALLALGCVQSEEVEKVKKIKLVDFQNRSVEVGEVNRVVAVGAGVLRLLVYLNATDMVVGVEETEHRWDPIGKDYSMTSAYEKFKQLPVIGPGGPDKPPSPELIAKVKPDLILMSSSLVSVYSPDRLQQEVGVPVLVVSLGVPGYADVDVLKKTFGLLGKALNKEERARELSKVMDDLLKDLSERTKNVSNPKVYIGAVSFKGTQPFTSTQSPYPPFEWINTKSVVDKYAKTQGFFPVDFEILIKEQPEIVFIDENNLALVQQDFERDKQKYCSIKAFKEGNVYGVLPFNYYWTNVATAFANAYYIGKILYPEKFEDVNPEKKAREIFKSFLGEDIYDKFLEKYPGFVKLNFTCTE